MSDDFEISGIGSEQALSRPFRLGKTLRKADSVGTPLRAAYDDDDAEAKPVPEEFCSLLQMLELHP